MIVNRQVNQCMKMRINGPHAVVVSAVGLLLAIAAWRAWELNDDIHGILMAMIGKLFSLLPQRDGAEMPSFRADSIFSLTETKLILVFRFMAFMLSMVAIFSALWARARGIFSAYYAAAVMIGFGTCMLVHKSAALGAAVMILIAAVAIEYATKRRYNSPLHPNVSPAQCRRIEGQE